jgi:hypothetical protein
MITVSFPLGLALPVKLQLDRFVIVWTGTDAPLGPFFQQYVSDETV